MAQIPLLLQVQDLLAKGYFPKELPECFSTTSYAQFIANNPAQNRLQIPSRTYPQPAIHNLARPGNARRVLHIPNPYSSFKVVEFFGQKWPDIRVHIAKSRLSVSHPVEDPRNIRYLIPAAQGSELPVLRARIRANSQFILKADITRFYNSIYTHSIPWALHSKTAAKRDRTNALFGNELDALVRNGQDQQTIGIPIGPDASLLIAEVIGSAVDQEMQQEYPNGFRFMDDYEFGFETRSEAEKALAKLRTALGNYELDLNPNKTSIEELPVELDKGWSAEIRGFHFADKLDKRRTEILSYFNRVFELHNQHRGESVLSYAISRFKSVDINESEWELLQNLLFNCAKVEPGTFEGILQILQFFVQKKWKLLDIFGQLIESIILRHGSLGQGSETASALWAAICFQRQISQATADSLDGNPDPCVALLALHARDLGLISPTVQFQKWQSEMTPDNLYGPQWLLAYEADIKGWLSSPSKHVDHDPFFSQLKTSKVSFFDVTALQLIQSRLSSNRDIIERIY